MKKNLLLIPVGLLATAGLVWTNYEQHVSSKGPTAVVKILTQDPMKLFVFEEHSVRQMIRYGDEKSIPLFQAYGDALDSILIKYKKLGIDTQNAQNILSQYKKDSQHLMHNASLYSQKLHTYSELEQNQEKVFLLSLEQIGLYELKTTFSNLEKARLEYIKKPSETTQRKYEKLTNDMTQMINELYLDASTEKPLLAYIKNHTNYFQTIVSVYTSTGLACIDRLHANSYAIKAQLELLPKSYV